MPTALTLALIWWFALGGWGLIFPYYTLYLRENAGLSGSEVGLVMASLPLIGLLMQPLWGQVADRTGLRSRVVTAVLAGTVLGYVALLHAQGFQGLLLATAGLALFAPAVVPNCVAVTLAFLPDGRGFGRARVMGTLGFGVTVISLPYLLRAYQQASPTASVDGAGIEGGLHLIFPVAAALVAVAALLSLLLPTGGAATLRAPPGQWRELLRNGAFRRALALAFLAFLVNQGPMVLFPILVRDQGGGVEAVSRMWILMLALEVPLVYHFGATLSRLGSRGVIVVGIGAAALRWAVSGFGDDLFWVYAAQLLHGVTVWGIVLGLPVYVDAAVPPSLRSTAQGLLAMLGVGLGSMLSNLGSGWLTEWIGPRAPAQIASLAGLALMAALPWMLPPTGPAPSRPDVST